MALAGDARLVFVGRSPESLYDLLLGLLAAPLLGCFRANSPALRCRRRLQERAAE